MDILTFSKHILYLYEHVMVWESTEWWIMLGEWSATPRKFITALGVSLFCLSI